MQARNGYLTSPHTFPARTNLSSLSPSSPSGSLVLRADVQSFCNLGSTSTTLSNISFEGTKIVRSIRHLEMQSKNRWSPKPINLDVARKTCRDMKRERKNDLLRKISRGFHPNHPLQFILWLVKLTDTLTDEMESQLIDKLEGYRKVREALHPGKLCIKLWQLFRAKPFLSVEEETKLIAQVQNSLMLEAEKRKLQSRLGREPTLSEWAKAVGLSSRVLLSQLHSGYRSRPKLVFANFRLVAYMTKKYKNFGLDSRDLFQAGLIGLMKGIERFKPDAGCKFSTYAFYWVESSTQRFAFNNSRPIRLPVSIYQKRGQINGAVSSFIEERNRLPSKEELAMRVGITVDKLLYLLFITRKPWVVFLYDRVSRYSRLTYADIIEDTTIETAEIAMARVIIRQHIHSLLSILTPRERQIIKLRNGFEDDRPKTLSEIGDMFGLSRERVRQLESRAFYKLRQRCDNHSQNVDFHRALLKFYCR